MGEQTAMVKQCMPVNEPIVVEKLTEYDVNETLDPGSAALDPAARFYPGNVRKLIMIRGKRKLILVLRPCKFFLFISPGSRTVMSDEGDLSLVPRPFTAKRWYIVGSNFSVTR